METNTISFGTPLSFRLSKWWGYALSVMFLLYGGIRILFSILDREAQVHAGQSTSILEPLLILGIGILLFMVVYEFSQGKKWSWTSLLLVNGAIAIAALAQLFGMGGTDSQTPIAQQYNQILLVLTISAMIALLLPSTQRFFNTNRP
jgi:hypothetical protein